MFYVSEIQTKSPSHFQTRLQELVYEVLGKLQIPFERVDTDEAITMEDCVAIDEKLNMRMVKTLFLCNRQRTQFYLFITVGNKPFCSKDFSNVLGVSRVSFAPLRRYGNYARHKNWCSDGTTIGYMKIRTEDENFYPIPNIRQLRLRCDMGLYQNRMVIKVGPSTLTNEMGKSDLRSFDRLACTLSDIQNMGHEVILDFSIFWCDCGRNK